MQIASDKKRQTGWVLIWLLLGCSSVLHAQSDTVTASASTKHWWQRYHPDSLVNKKISLLPIPVLSSSPETGVRFGVVLQYFLNTGTKKDSSHKARDSYAYLEALYSTRQQTVIESYLQLFTPGEKYFVRNRIGFAKNNERLWGFGNSTVANTQYERVKYQRLYWQASFTRQLKNRFFAGVNTNFSHTDHVQLEVKDTNLLAGQPGEKGSRVAGIGPTLIWDKRDHPLTPHTGWYGELAITYQVKALGSDFNYTEYFADFRKYFLLQNNRVLAFQGLALLTNGTVPWREQARMGNATIMRGYFSGRFRGNQYLAAQAEYRFPVHRLANLAVFGSVGQVQQSIDRLALQDTKAAGGVGLRVLVNKAKQIYTRFDYAVSTDHTSGFYFKIGEAF